MSKMMSMLASCSGSSLEPIDCETAVALGPGEWNLAKISESIEGFWGWVSWSLSEAPHHPISKTVLADSDLQQV